MSPKRQFEIVSPEERIARISRWIIDTAVVILLALFLTHMFCTRVTMNGNSMSPTLENGDVLLLSRLKGSVLRIRRFDMVVYRLEGSSDIYIKRVLGLPGETVQILDGRVYIDGEPLESDLLAGGIASAGVAVEPVVLESGEYFVIGENSDASLDSRFTDVGNVLDTLILGTVWFRVAPFRDIGPVS